jgi:ArsR family transcriptional regulator
MQAKKAKPAMTDFQIAEAARHFGLLAEPARLVLLRALMSGPANVGQLVERTGLKQGNVSKHLGIMLGSRFVERRREGNYVIYAIADQSLFQLCELMCRRIEADATTQAKRLAAGRR